MTRALLVAFLAVAATALVPARADAVVDLLRLIAVVLLLGTATAWYLTSAAHRQREPYPKVQWVGAGLLVVLLGSLYGALAGALPLPPALATAVHSSLDAATAAALLVAAAACVDLGQPARGPLARGLSLLLAASVAVGTLAPALAGAAGRGVLSTTVNPLASGLLGAAVGVGAPLEWLLELDRRQRSFVLAGACAAIVPLAVVLARPSAGAGSTAILPAAVTAAAIELGAAAVLGCLLAAIARVGLALPGAGAYERKLRELEAVYDFGLTAHTALDAEQLRIGVLEALLAVAEPDVALLVERGQEAGDGCRCVLLRAEAGERHVYRFGARAGWGALAARFADRRPVVIEDHRHAEAGVLRRLWEPGAGSSVIVPVVPRDGALRALLIAGRFHEYAFRAAEVRSLANFATQVALAFDHVRLLRETVEAERRKRELEIAREVQLRLLPAGPPRLPGLAVASRSEPATEVGGDYYDYLELPAGRFGIVFGDVAGHGVPAGLLLAIAKSAIHTQVRAGADLPELLPTLSTILLQMSADNQFMTMVLLEIDGCCRRFRYANAGHHYPLHYRARTGAIEELVSTGLPLGILPRPPGPFVDGVLEPGDLLVLYSDGIVEAMRPSDEEAFGLSRLRHLVLAHRDRDPDTMVEAVFRAVREYRGGAPLDDDASMLVVRVLGFPHATGGEHEQGALGSK